MTDTRPRRYRADATDTRFFQLIADGVSRMLGFGVVVMSVRDAEALVAVAVSEGAELGRLPDGTPVPAASMLGGRWPIEEVNAALAAADDWGSFKFTATLDAPTAGTAWKTGASRSDDLTGWHPRSALRAPIYDAEGELIGSLGVDLPPDGRVPGPAQLAVLERYAEQATKAILAALERSRLTERARLLRTARDAVRRASAHDTLVGAVDEASAAIFEGFGIVGLRVRVFDDEEPGFVRSLGERPISTSSELIALSRAAAEELWRRGEVAARGIHQAVNATLPPDATRLVIGDLTRNGLDSLLLVPLGSGDTCWGALVLLRDAGAPNWTETECAVALDIGRDLGQVLHRARTRERQRALIRDLSALDDYQSSLITTVAEQLRGPLRTIEENLDRIGDPSRGIDEAALVGIEQGAGVMTEVVEALLLLSRLAHPDDRPRREILDLRAVVRRTTKAAAPEAATRGLALSAHLPADAVRVDGDGGELDRLLSELLENALRYTPAGGTVSVRLERNVTKAELVVADNGIGIAADERPRVLTDFYRGPAARAVAPNGSGLGMSIVDRIARRHDGCVEIESEAGSGTLVRVTLPIAQTLTGAQP
jgi:signal transduction histidine kinase